MLRFRKRRKARHEAALAEATAQKSVADAALVEAEMRQKAAKSEASAARAEAKARRVAAEADAAEQSNYLQSLAEYRETVERLGADDGHVTVTAESTTPELAEEDPDAQDWRLVGTGLEKDGSTIDKATVRNRARRLVRDNPYGRSILWQLGNYVFGTGLGLHFVLADGVVDEDAENPDSELNTLMAMANSALLELLEQADEDNGGDLQRESGSRTWRDGECFMRLFSSNTWPVPIAPVDPELVGRPQGRGDEVPASGIEHDGKDSRRAERYYVLKSAGGELDSNSPVLASRMVHAKINADGNEPRGLTLFYPVLGWLSKFNGLIDTKLAEMKLKASIVLIRRHKKASPGQVASMADGQKTGTTNYPEKAGVRRQKFRPGTIIDTNEGVDFEFAEAKGHFADADTLMRRILLTIASGVDLPEYILTADSSNSNLASTMVAEGPAVRAFITWQRFYFRFWRQVIRKAFAMHPDEALAAKVEHLLKLESSPEPMVARNRLDEMKANEVAVNVGAMSPQEVARRDGLDPVRMRDEIAQSESSLDPVAQLNRQRAEDAAAGLDADEEVDGDEA